jgi:muramoyltetrapeptide carboxypeptidase
MNFNPFPEHIRHLAIISPAGPIPGEKVERAVESITSLGLKVTVQPHVYGPSDIKYLAAGIQQRVEDLHACWKDTSIDLVLAARGGYGTAQLLPYLDWELLKSRKLPLLGYSDITALHLAMYAKNAGIPVTSPMAGQLPNAMNDGFTGKWLRLALQKKSKPESLTVDRKSSIRFIKKQQTCALMIAANLTVLNSMIGTPYMPDLHGHILLLEDLKEPLYKLDRLLTQLRLAGILEQCAGVFFGDFRYCGNKKDRDELFRSFAEFIPGPVASGLQFGHRMPMFCLRYGTQIKVSDDDEIVLNPVVK